jgi:Uma2 family endonuclease
MPGETARKLKSLDRLLKALQAHVRAAGAGTVYPPGTAVHLPGGDIVFPDLVVVVKPLPVRDGILGAPDILVQILHASDPNRERVERRSLYEKNGVAEYWVLDVAGGAIEVFALQGAAYAAPRAFPKGSLLTSAALPGLALAITSLFE